MTEYEILILEVGPNSVQYAFAWEGSDTLHRYSCSLSIFLALYSRQWKEPQPCSPLSSSVSKTSWLKQARSFFASVIPWVKRNVSRLNPF